MRIRHLVLFSFAWISAAHAADSFSPKDFSSFQQAWNGTIPYPAERLKDSLLLLDPQSKIDAAIFPHGRSLERSTTDFEYPRTVMAWRNESLSAPYYLFVGYTPKNEQLEVISWNWDTRQLDFGVVIDYAEGKTPRYLNANRMGCIACHQSRVPLFAPAPWNETTTNASVLARLKSETKDPFAQFWLNREDDPKNRDRLSPAGFDLGIRKSARIVMMQTFCGSACGGDLVCRKQVLETALVQARRDASQLNYFEPKELQERVSSMERNGPSGGYSFSSSIIQDRTLGSDGYAFTPDEDPLRIRNRTVEITPASAVLFPFMADYRYCWNFTNDQRTVLEGFTVSDFKKIMNSGQMIDAVKSWPPSESDVFAAILAASDSPTPVSGPMQVDWKEPPKEPRFVRDPSRPKKETIALFQRYCTSCHGNPRHSQPPRLPLGSIDEMKTYVGSAGRTVKEMIDPDKPLMPPLLAPQPSFEEINQMFSGI